MAVPVSELQMKIDPKRAEFFGSRMAAHGLDSVEAYFEEIRKYTMLDVADQITCPTLAVECEGDFAGGGGPSLIAAMSAPTTLLELSAADGDGRSLRRTGPAGLGGPGVRVDPPGARILTLSVETATVPAEFPRACRVCAPCTSTETMQEPDSRSCDQLFGDDEGFLAGCW